MVSMQVMCGARTKKGETCSHLSYVEKLTFGRGLEAGSEFGSGATEEGVLIRRNNSRSKSYC